MDELLPGQIRFRVHPTLEDDGRVSAAVFAEKLATLVRALKAADAAANNGKLVHDYTIARLKSSSPTAILAEEPLERPEHIIPPPSMSGIMAFEDCVAAIQLGDPSALKFGATARQVAKLAGGAPTRFGYGEIATANDNNIIRVDPFLREQATAIVSPPKPETAKWFKGAAHGSFVGTINVVDLRGALPQIKLTLSAGGKLIDCVCHADDLDDIKAGLKRRVRITGRAIYDGKSGLPRRVIVSDIYLMSEDADFSRWQGTFKPFDVPQWEGDDA